MINYTILILSIFIFHSSLVFAEKLNNCPNQNLENFQFINFPVNDTCRTQSVEYKLIQAMNFIFTTGLIKLIESKDQTFKPSSNFRQWHQLVNKNVKQFMYVDYCGSENVVAYVQKDIPGIIYLCANLISEDQFTVLDLVSAILHEVRHFSGPSHVECSHGQKKYSISCDESIDIQGSYAFSLWTYVQIAYGTQNIHPVSRLLARASADVLLQNNFNRLPLIESKINLVGSAESGELFKIESDHLQLLNFKINDSGSIYIINNFWYLVSQKDFQIKNIFNPLFNLKIIKQVFQDDLNFSINKLNSKLIDFYKLGQIVGLLEKRKLTIVCPNRNFEFKNSNYVSFILSDRSKPETIRLLKNNGYIDTFYCDEGRFDKSSYDSESVKNTIRIVKLQHQDYSLNNQGFIFVRNRLSEGGYNNWQILNPNGPKILSIQLYDSKLYFDQLQ